MKINVKTFAGIGVGLVAGYFLFKNADKKYLKIGGVGLAGGLLANLLLNRDSKKKQVTLSTKNYIQSAEDELLDDETGDVSMVEVPTIYPLNEPTSVSENFDIDLGLPQ
jgi:hypothetical protein